MVQNSKSVEILRTNLKTKTTARELPTIQVRRPTLPMLATPNYRIEQHHPYTHGINGQAFI